MDSARGVETTPAGLPGPVGSLAWLTARSQHREKQGRTVIFVPAWNEAGSVGAVVTGIRLELPEATVLVVDDGSADGTAEKARAAGAEVATLPFNAGLGTALQTGYRFADEGDFDYFAHLDADGQHPPNELPKILEPVWEGKADLVVGSRFVRDHDGTSSKFRSSALRRFWIFLLARLLSLISRQRFTDITSGFRAGDRRAIELFAHLYQPDFGEIEALQTALSEGLRVREEPVVMLERSLGTSYLTAFQSFMFMFKSMILIVVGRFRGAAR
jgi:glycosyltransferase involved in cell wall biosynthesis